MENDYLQALAQVVLPTEILDYFSITGIAQTTTEIHISLDERMNKALSNDAHFESKGFMEVANVTDFPIRDHKVILKIRRRRWKDWTSSSMSLFHSLKRKESRRNDLSLPLKFHCDGFLRLMIIEILVVAPGGKPGAF